MSANIQRRNFLNEAIRRMSKFDRTGMAYRAEDVEKYFKALAVGRKVKVARPKPVKLQTSKSRGDPSI